MARGGITCTSDLLIHFQKFRLRLHGLWTLNQTFKVFSSQETTSICSGSLKEILGEAVLSINAVSVNRFIRIPHSF